MNTDSINDIGAKRVIRSENSDDDYLFPEAYFYEDGAEKCPYGHFLTRFDVEENGLILKDCITSDSYEIEILLFILEITVPDLFRGLGIANRKVAKMIMAKIKINIFLYSLINTLPRLAR